VNKDYQLNNSISARLVRQRWTFLFSLAAEFLHSLAMSEIESSYLLQRISVAIQRFNLVLLHDSLADDIPDS